MTAWEEGGGVFISILLKEAAKLPAMQVFVEPGILKYYATEIPQVVLTMIPYGLDVSLWVRPT